MSEVVEIWAKAIERRNSKLMVSMYDDNAIFLAAFNGDILKGHKQIQDYFKSFLNKDRLVCTIIKNEVQSIGQNLSIHSGIYTFDYFDNGKPKSVLARYSFVILRNKILNQHSSIVPV